MVQGEFESKFVGFMTANKLKPLKRDINFEWEVFQEFQYNICRDVGFEEYRGMMVNDWLEK